MAYKFKFPPGCKLDADRVPNLDAYNIAQQYITSARVALDIGAHVGIMSRIMAKTFEEVISFEPLWYNYLKENTQDLDNISINPVGLGNADTKETIYVLDRNSGGSSIVPHKRRTWQKDAPTKQIVIKPLDSFNLPMIDFIKIDVESYEYFVIDGARETLTRTSPIIMVEFLHKYRHPTHPPEATTELLNDLGYIQMGYTGHDFIFKKVS